MWCLRCGFCCEDENCEFFKRVRNYGLGHCMIYDDRPEQCRLKMPNYLTEQLRNCPIGRNFWESVGICDEIRTMLEALEVSV